MQATISQSGNRISIQGPYDADFIKAIKDAVPYQSREWDGAHKAWLVDAEFEKTALKVAGQYYEIIDARKLNAEQVEEAKLNDEVKRIKANQEYVLANEKWINDRIESLSSEISRYSMRSVSNVKHGNVMDRALLQHALDNARIPIEKLTELQVRGLQAARRYVEGA